MVDADRQELLLKRSILAVQSGRLGDARGMLTDLLRQNPQNAAAWLWLGKALDDPKKRRDCFTQVLRLDPDNDEARLALVALRSGPQQPEEAAGDGETPGRIMAHPSSCRQCASHLQYDIRSKGLRCPHCGTRYKFEQTLVAPTWFSLPPDLSMAEAQSEPVGQKSLHCRSCGATTVLSSRTASLSCPYCGSPQVVQTEALTPRIPPHAIIPFQVDRQGAESALREWFGQGLWSPGNLAKKAEIVDLHGTYVPFWTFKGLAEISYQTDYASPVVRGPSRQQNYVPVDDTLLPATYTLDSRTLDQIKPFHLEDSLPFQPAYLSGWPAEVYQVALADATIQAREEMSKEARVKAEAWAPPAQDVTTMEWGSLGGGQWGVRSGRRQKSTVYRAHFWTMHLDSFQHLLLPVWFGSYRYRGRLFSVAINGQTGRVGGESPRSAGMVTLTAALGLIFLVALVGVIVRLLPRIAEWMGQDVPESQTSSSNGSLILYGAVVLVLALFGLLSRWSSIRRWLGKE